MTLKQGVQQVTRGGVEWWYHAMNRMVRCRTVAELLDLAYDAIRGGLGCQRVGVFLVDPARHTLSACISTDAAGRKVYPADQIIPLDSGLYHDLLCDPRIRADGPGYLYLATPSAETLDAAATLYSDETPRTLCVALRTYAAVHGLITVSCLDGERLPDPAPLVALAIALAAALENAAHVDASADGPVPIARTDASADGSAPIAPIARTDASADSRTNGTLMSSSADGLVPIAGPRDAAMKGGSRVTKHARHEERDWAMSASPRLDTTPERSRWHGPYEDARPWHDHVSAPPPEHDTVTDVLSRRAMFDRLSALVTAAQPLAVLLVDIDNFRLFNDTHGHALGDQVLRKIATLLRQCCGAEDVAARYGNDEFLVLLHHAGVNEARAVLRRMETALRAHAYVAPDGSTIPHSVSAGLACFPANGRTPESLVAAAEQSLAAAKRGAYQPRRRPLAHLLEKSHLGVLTGLVTAVDSKDRYTRQHSEDVTRYALLLAEALGLDAAQRRVLALAGPLHDVGKIAVPDRILRKPGKLTREEFELMKHHVSFGVAIIQGVLHDEAVLEAVAHHHERWDGRGYPAGLPGARVSLAGRIMQITDAVSAMRQSRPYRQGLPWSHIVTELRAGAGVQFDPDLVEPFIGVVGRLRA